MTIRMTIRAGLAALALLPAGVHAQIQNPQTQYPQPQISQNAEAQPDEPAMAEEAVQEAVVETATATSDIVVTAEDGTLVHGTAWFADLPETAPLIALFHQAGSNGRGEYGPLIGWLNGNGYRAITWDLRKGGTRFGGTNRSALTGDDSQSYCDAWTDMRAAVDNSAGHAGSAPLIVWGSSYTGSLVFRAAAENAAVDGVIAFSPASGGPMAECRAELYLSRLAVSAYVMRPETEMEIETVLAQRDTFEAAGVAFTVVGNGVHGSSMLVDQRTEHDMAPARAEVMNWLSWLRENTAPM